MKLKQFKRMTDVYGADSLRWPARLRFGAQALLGQSSEATEILQRARELDEALARTTVTRDGPRPLNEDPDAALVRLRSGVMTRIRTSVHPDGKSIRTSPPTGELAIGLWRHRWIGLTAAASLAVLGGLVLGFTYAPTPPQQDIVTLLQPAPVHFLVN